VFSRRGGVMRGLICAVAFMVAGVSPAAGRDDTFHIWPIEQACLKSFTDFAAYAGCVKTGMMEGRQTPLPAETFFIGYLDAFAALSGTNYFDIETQRILYQFGRMVWQSDKPAGREHANPWRTAEIFFLAHALTATQNQLPLPKTAIDEKMFYGFPAKAPSRDKLKRIRAADERCFRVSPFFPDIADCIAEALVPAEGGRTPKDQYLAAYLRAIADLSSTGLFNRESIIMFYLQSRKDWIEAADDMEEVYKGRTETRPLNDVWYLIVGGSMTAWSAGGTKLPAFRPSAETLQFLESLAKSNSFDFITVQASCPNGETARVGFDWSRVPPSKTVADPATGGAKLFCADGQPATPTVPTGAPFSIRVPLVSQNQMPALRR